VTAIVRTTNAGAGRGGSSTPRRAFTLVELLVVIAIITLLMSITMPALQAAWRQVNRAQCRSNLGQIGKGLYTYALNFTRMLPPCEGYGFDVWNATPGWVGLGHLLGHGGFTEDDGKLFYCPSYKSSDWHPSMPDYAAVYVGHGMYDYQYGGSMYGWKYVRQGTRTISSYQYRASGFDHPYAEGGFGRLLCLDKDGGRSLVADQLDWRFGPDFAHKVGLHVLFIDGHVAWFRDSSRHIQTTGYPWSGDDGGPKYEVFWQLFDKLPSGDADLGKLAQAATAP